MRATTGEEVFKILLVSNTRKSNVNTKFNLADFLRLTKKFRVISLFGHAQLST